MSGSGGRALLEDTELSKYDCQFISLKTEMQTSTNLRIVGSGIGWTRHCCSWGACSELDATN